MKITLIIVIIFQLPNLTMAQKIYKQVEVSYIRNRDTINNFNLYFIINDSLNPITIKNGYALLNEKHLSENKTIYFTYKKEKLSLSGFDFSIAPFIHIYYDSRIINNPVHKKFGGYVKLKYLFRKRYLYYDGLGYANIITIKHKHKKGYPIKEF